MRFTLITAAASILLLCPSAQAETWQDAIDDVYAEWNEPDSAGCMVHIVTDGKVAFSRGYGMANIEEKIPIGETIRFNIASTSKQFTAASIAKLSLEGKLSLDADIHTILPYLPDYGHAVTVRHLIHHISGIPEVLGELEKAEDQYKDGWGNPQAIEHLKTMDELYFTPGSEYRYCNSNYILLAEMVHAVSGKPLSQYADEHFFKPLGMTKTRVSDNLDRLYDPDVAQSYRKTYKHGFTRYQRNDFLVGDGNVETTVVDFAKWSENYGTREVGGDELFDLMLTKGTLNNGEEIPYAFGVIVTEHLGRRCLQHGGGWLGYRCYWGYYPESNTTILIFANHGRSRVYQDETAEIYFEAMGK